MISRRVFLTFCAAILAMPLVADAQQPPKVPRIGILFPTPHDPASAARVLEPFRQQLRELNYIEGQNIVIEYRLGGRGDRLRDLAAELVQHQVDIIVAANTPAAKAAQQATRTIPIVANMGDSIEMGLATTLAAPGGNITGVSGQFGATAGKRLELLKEAVPRASRVAVLWNAANPNKALEWKETQTAARTSGVTLQSVEVRAFDDFERAFSAITRGRADAVITVTESLTITHRRQIVAFTTKRRLPMIAAYRDFAEAGGLMSYGVSPRDQYRRLAVYVDKILKGAKPGDLPIEQPTKFELVINMKTAKALGLTIPPSILLRADQVIE
jgi:putative ABC transport system substrate-binding protein